MTQVGLSIVAFKVSDNFGDNQVENDCLRQGLFQGGARGGICPP